MCSGVSSVKERREIVKCWVNRPSHREGVKEDYPVVVAARLTILDPLFYSLAFVPILPPLHYRDHHCFLLTSARDHELLVDKVRFSPHHYVDVMFQQGQSTRRNLLLIHQIHQRVRGNPRGRGSKRNIESVSLARTLLLHRFVLHKF